MPELNIDTDAADGIPPEGPLNDSKITILKPTKSRLTDDLGANLQADGEVSFRQHPQKAMRAHFTANSQRDKLDVFVRDTYDLSIAIASPIEGKFPFKKKSGNLFSAYRPAGIQLLNGNSHFLIGKSFFPLQMYEKIRNHLQRGLIVVCGETSSGKSVFVQQLIFEILKHKWEGISSPAQNQTLHYITLEDPIEVPFYLQSSGAPLLDPAFTLSPATSALDPKLVMVQATHREKGKQCKDLPSFFSSALRQKPCLALVGELRDKADWDPIIDYAVTGHLAVTTCHAGSIKECLSKILLATDGDRNPAKRSFVASALLAIIHLQALPGVTPKVILPSVYIFNQKGTARMIADNLDCVLPGSSEPNLGYLSSFDSLVTAEAFRQFPHLTDRVRNAAINLDLSLTGVSHS